MRDYERIHPLTRQDWREWLAANHATSPGIWLVSYKQATGKQRMAYDELVEEALCFGWVDSKANTLDGERSMLLLTPRKPKSGWSKTNKERLRRLTAQGLMTPPGLAKVAAAKADGSWSLLDAIEELIMPADLASALPANATAKKHFDAFPPSTKKAIYWWIESAKRPDTRGRRVEETVRLASQNIRANQYEPKNRA